MAGMFLFGLEWEAGLTIVLAGSGANVLMGSFAHLIARTEQRRQENQRLFGDLQEAYRQLKDSAAQAEALAAATERHRLVRELHDSLTQTLFSMNLAVQSAQLSFAEVPLRRKNISSACKPWRAVQPVKCRLSPGRLHSVRSPRVGWQQPSNSWQRSGWHRMGCR